MFLSQLDKINNPITNLNLTLEIDGIYNLPTEWNLVEEQNPNIFKYHLKYLNYVVEGTFNPKVISAKEQKANQNQKGAKKAADPVQEEAQIAKEEEEEQNYFKNMNQLTEQEQFYLKSEYKYHGSSIKFQNSICQQLSLEEIQYLEEKIQEKKGDYVYLTRSCTIKDLKAKPKNMANQEMLDLTIKTWINLSIFNQPGTFQSQKNRIPIKQVTFDEYPKFDFKNSYLSYKISLSKPLNAQIDKIEPPIQNFLFSKQIDNQNNYVNQFRAEIAYQTELFNQEYMQMFHIDKSQGLSKTLTIQKMQDLKKRKDQFLQEFFRSGKYEFVKENLKQQILQICVDKYKKQSLPIKNQNQKYHILSELNIFLHKQMNQAVNQVVQEKFMDFHEDLVIKQDLVNKDQNRIETKIQSINFQERQLAASFEYEVLNNFKLSEKCLLNLIVNDQQNHLSWYQYTKFLLRRKNFTQAEQTLQKAIYLDNQNLEYKKILSLLLIIRQRYKEALIIVQKLFQNDKKNIILIQIIYIIYKIYLKDSKQAEIYYEKFKTCYMYQTGLIQKQQKQSEDIFALPSYKQKIQQAKQKIIERPILNQEQLDNITFKLIDFLSEHRMYPIVQKVMELINDKSSFKYEERKSYIDIFYENYQDSMNFYNNTIKKEGKSYKIQELKADVCFLTDKFFEFEETVLDVLNLKKKSWQYLRLGYVYLQRQAWQDAIEVFKIGIKLQEQSQLSWLGLGIAQLRIQDYQLSEEAFQQANILDPFNPDTYGYYAILCQEQGKRNEQLNFCLEKTIENDISNPQLVFEIFFNLQKQKNSQSEKFFNLLLKVCNQYSLYSMFALKFINFDNKIAKIFCQKAQESAINDSEKAKVLELIKNL